MQVAELLDELGYRGSPNFLRRRQSALTTVVDVGHIFRRAKSNLGLQGVYTLRPPSDEATSVVPVVYVCKAADDKEADKIHRLVWNQDVVPFLIVQTPSSVKLYSGFRHSRTPSGNVAGVLQTLSDFNNLSDLIEDFHADSIDSGSLWKRRGKNVTPEYRVDWKLLDNLRTLDRWLCENGLKRVASHALIGKYVYLHYLHDRGILSPKKLARWGIEKSSIFGRDATIDGACAVIEQLDDWLNGSIFPINFGGKHAPKQKHLRCVAGVFSGDEVTEVGNRQLSLDFQAYDFSYIPIETLSIVYEQFLHAPDQPGKPSRGRQIGAYYTPIPVVNLMLAELEERRPLEKGMRVLDPSCGSGAFLVQCYRRLIEREFPPGRKPTPAQLRDLLERTIFGVDVEGDACNVTELSLILTLLDYIHPPDLEGRGRSRFQLPILRDSNIFCENFFDKPAARHKPLKRTFDWIVGNPPWKRLNPDHLAKDERPIWKWIKANEKSRPVGGNQVARAFAWEVLDYLAPDGEIGLFLPAMTLFENPAHRFRQEFFQEVKVNTVVNFSNLAEVLAAGRFRVPAASFFYERRNDGTLTLDEDEYVRTYSPLVANQESTRPVTQGIRNELWSIVINASEIRDIPTMQIAGGNGLPWKLATWGSSLDLKLLSKLERRFPLMSDLERDDVIVVAEGPALVAQHVPSGPGKTVKIDEVVGKKVLDTTELARWRRVFSFDKSALKDNDKFYGSVRRGFRGLEVCRPSHVIVSAARNFAVYSEKFLVVPPRQIGIVSPSIDKRFLKALSLYLSSDFAFYHQFLTSTEFGVKRDRSTLGALRRLPIAVPESAQRLNTWTKLHSRLMKTTPRRITDVNVTKRSENQLLLPIDDFDDDLTELLDELNILVSECLDLDEGERALVHDLVQVRLALNDGKIGKPAIRAPKASELRSYAKRLKLELDHFINGELPKLHNVCVVYDNLSGMIQVDLVRASSAWPRARVVKADDANVRQLQKTRDRLRDERSQWVYFDRNLRIYEGTRTYLLKPMQRFHWTESQAMIDARKIIAETLEGVEIKA